MSRERHQLTPRQRAFAHAFVGDAKRNATEAARMAGYSGSDAALRVRGHENVTNRNVAAYIAELEGPALERNAVTAERLIEQAACTAFVDPASLYKRDAKGRLVPREIDEIPPETRAAMLHHEQVFANGKFVGWKVRWRDSLKAIELLGRTERLKLFVERREYSTTDELSEALAAMVESVRDRTNSVLEYWIRS